MDVRMVLTEARLFATPLAQRIAEEANRKAPDEVGTFAGTCASLVLQTVTVSLLLQKFAPGSPAGEEMIRAIYASALEDALERWHKSDLKERGFGPKGGG